MSVGMLALCDQVGRHARAAARLREPSFAIPELSPAAVWVAATSRDAAIRDEAAAWLQAGASYHALVRLCERMVLGLDASRPSSGGRYRDKVHGELEPMLDLWPDVILLPTVDPLTPFDLIELRAFPVHPLGLVDRPTWTDGAEDTPSEFFFHDLDHARFKVREDLLFEGVDIPDAYRDGQTLDLETGRHRLIMAHARGRIEGRLWARAPSRAAFGRRLRDGVADIDGPRRSAAELLLFEIIHEKSFPLEAAVLDRELAADAHLAKLRTKAANRFFAGGVDDVVVAELPWARAALREMIA